MTNFTKIRPVKADGQRDRQADTGKASLRSRSAEVPKRTDLILKRVKGIVMAIQSEHVVVFHQIK
jgi:hypothetical protein